MKPEDLVGKKIISAKFSKILEEYDDIPYLDLEFEDGSKVRVVAQYGGWTGSSEDEYPRFIEIKEELP